MALCGVFVARELSAGAPLALTAAPAFVTALAAPAALASAVAASAFVTAVVSPFAVTLSCGSATGLTVASSAASAGEVSVGCETLAAEITRNKAFECFVFTVKATCKKLLLMN
jgi:hypothetical protein